MLPIIGILPSIKNDNGVHFINNDNIQAIIEAGGHPIILPYGMHEQIAEQDAKVIDGLYLTGGNDVDPALFNEEPHPKLREINPIRDHDELVLTRKMLQMDKPILAVCKGIQILNIAMGGDMYQDIYSQIDHSLLQHSQKAPADHGSHFVHIKKQSLLYKIVKSERIKVNSRHHQANRRPGKHVLYGGIASDGMIEALESTVHSFVLGVQWHPENMAVKGNKEAKAIYASFINACKMIK